MDEPRRPRHDSTAVHSEDNGRFHGPNIADVEHPEGSDSGEAEGDDEVDES